MRTRYTLVPTLCLAIAAQSQNLNNVLFNPNPIHECENVNLTLIGNYPSNNYAPLLYTFDPGTFILEFQANGTGTSPQTPFSEAIPPLGPWDPGTYLFTAHLNLNGTIVDTWTTTINVLPQTQHDPGIDTFADVCNAGTPYPLISLLDGTPDTGGQWLDPFGQPHNNTFTPGVDQAGAWVYQFLAPLLCHTDTSAQLFISYLPNNNPGISGTAAICVTAGPTPLINYLFGSPDAGGTWTGPSPVSGGMYDPATMNPGVYTYTVPGISPCPGPSATVTVTEVSANNAGTGSSAQICSDLTAVPLNTYLSGGPQQTGSWVDPLGFGFGNYAATFNAQEDFSGTYLYIVANGTCPPDTAFVSISLIPNTSAGTSTTSNICVISGPVDLYGELLGFPNTGGTWTAPGGGPFDGTYDPAIDAPGAYVYTVDGMAPCPDPSATVTVVEQPLSNAGTGDSASICILDTLAELYYHLTDAPQTTGYWFTPNGDTLGTYTATINAVMSDPGVYTYVVNNAPCDPDSAFVTVTVVPTPCIPGYAELDPGIAQLSVMPNPSGGMITVEIQLARMSGGHTLEVMNMNGQVLHREPVIFSGTTHQRTLDLSSLPAGAYVLRLSSTDGMAVQQFMLH